MHTKSPLLSFDEKLSAIIGLVIGLLFLVGGGWVRQIEAHEQATLHEAEGVVVDSIRRRERAPSSNQEKVTYAPVIEFLADGDRTRFTGKYEAYPSSQGNRVIVRYDPKQPATTARVVSTLEGWTSWAMFGMGGLATVSSLSKLLKASY